MFASGKWLSIANGVSSDNRSGQGCGRCRGVPRLPDIEKRGSYGEGYRTEDDAGDSKECDSTEDRDQNRGGMLAKPRTDQHGVEEVVDEADDSSSPDCEESGFAPVAVEAEVERDGDPDEEGSEGGNHRQDSGEDGPEEMVGDAENPVGETSESALNAGDGETSKGGCVDCVSDAFDQSIGLSGPERKERANEGDGELAVAEEKEEDEEHDDDLRDRSEGTSDEAGEPAPDEGGDGPRRVLRIERVGDGVDPHGEGGMVVEVGSDFLLRGVAAKRGDDVDRLLGEVVREEVDRRDDDDQDKYECQSGAGIAIADLCREPLVRSMADDGEDGCSDQGREERQKDKRADDEDSEGEQKERDLLP